MKKLFASISNIKKQELLTHKEDFTPQTFGPECFLFLFNCNFSISPF